MIEVRPNIKLHNADCMEIMAGYPDGYFDLAIVDPPYGIGMDGQIESFPKNPKHKRKHIETKGWDSAIPDAGYFFELQRVSEHQIIWGGNYFLQHLNEGHKGWVVWYKGQQGLNMSDCELAYGSMDVPTRVCTINRSILAIEGTIHPTQKPVALYRWLLDNYAKQGMKILDTHLGSGSHAIAAHYLGVGEFVGVELDKDYFEASVKRIKENTVQADLFKPHTHPQAEQLSIDL